MINPAQIHLALNHVPVVLAILTLPLLTWAMLKNNSTIRNLSWGLLAVAAVFATPVYFTGEGAEELVEHKPAVTEDYIHEHEEAAEVAIILIAITGVAGAAALAMVQLKKNIPTALPIAILIANLVSAGALLRTAHLGGLVRHDELRVSAAVSSNKSTSV